MTAPRIKSYIFIDAFRRRAAAAGAQTVIVHKGDIDAGAIVIKYFDGDGRARLRAQSVDLDGNAVWAAPLEKQTKDAMRRSGAKIRRSDGLAAGWAADALEKAEIKADPAADDPNKTLEQEVDEWIARARNIDPDLWVVEVENSNGQLFLD